MNATHSKETPIGGCVKRLVRCLWLWRRGVIGVSPFPSMQIRGLGTFTKTPWGWREARKFEVKCFMPNDKLTGG
jgi:hypothetical protein